MVYLGDDPRQTCGDVVARCGACQRILERAIHASLRRYVLEVISVPVPVFEPGGILKIL
jgi:hypothetical protein